MFLFPFQSLLRSANLQIHRILRRFSATKTLKFSTLEKVAANAFCPLRLCVFAFQMPLVAAKPRWVDAEKSSCNTILKR
jgi:hypothetical protein